MKKMMSKLFALRLKICKYFIKAKAIERRQEKKDLFDLQQKTILKLLLVDKTTKDSVKLFEFIQNEYLTRQQANLDKLIVDKKNLETLLNKNRHNEH